MNIGKQLKEIREYLGFSQNDFANVLGISPKAYWNYEKNIREIPSGLVRKISKDYKINPSWLVNGEGNMFLEELTFGVVKDKSILGIPNNEVMEMVAKANDFVYIPVYGDVVASLGYGITTYNENQTATYAISKELANDLGIRKANAQMIFAQGDSMEPTIIGGDSLLVDTSKNEVYDGKIYCVRIDGQLYAKRLQKIPPDKIKVVSDNQEKYDAFYVEKNSNFDFAIIGEVKWWGRVSK